MALSRLFSSRLVKGLAGISFIGVYTCKYQFFKNTLTGKISLSANTNDLHIKVSAIQPIESMQAHMPITLNEVAIAFNLESKDIKCFRRGFGGVGYDIFFDRSVNVSDISKILKKYNLQDLLLRTFDENHELTIYQLGDEDFIKFINARNNEAKSIEPAAKI